MTAETDRTKREGAKLAEELPTQRLVQEVKSLLEAFAEKLLASVGDKVSDKVDDLSHGLLDKVGEGGGGPGVKAAVSGVRALAEGKSPVRAVLGAGMTGLKEGVKKLFRGKGGGKKALKLTNIVESIDVGVPLRLAYDQWCQFEDFPTFMKKVESVERPEDEKTNWKTQVFWSHRSWEATILEQVPDSHIVWRSKGAKGYVDGAVSFSELAPNLTRILLVMEYHPQGLFEHTGNLWRAQGRRARLEFKHFRRHMMAHAILEPDEVEGWRGEIREGEVVKSHEDALEEEKRAPEEEAPPEEKREEPEEGREEPEPEEGREEGREEPEEGREEPEEPEEPEEGREEPEEDREREPQGEPEEPEEPEPTAEAEDEEEEEEEPEEPPRRPRRRPAEERRRPRERPRRRPAEDEDQEDQGDREDEEEAERPAPARRPRRRVPRDRQED